VVDENAAAQRHATPTHSSLWLGGSGSTTQAHYDVLHNVFVQVCIPCPLCEVDPWQGLGAWRVKRAAEETERRALVTLWHWPRVNPCLLCVQVYGCKRFRMWGPNAHMQLRVFPDAHPRARKAQALIDDEASNLPAPEMDVMLEAGEALFIPAFWFHHVEAASPSVSVNVFSENAIKLAAQHVLMQPPPTSLLRAASSLSRGDTDPRGISTTAAQHVGAAARALQATLKLERSLLGSVAARYEALASSALHVQRAVSDAAGAACSPHSRHSSARPAGPRHVASGARGERRGEDDVRAEIQHVGAEYAKVEAAVGACAHAQHSEGLREVIAAHLFESWVLRSFGAEGAGNLIRAAASSPSLQL
jgi:hypothetical protein